MSMSIAKPSRDFIAGAMTVVGLVAVRSLINLFRSPSITAASKMSSKQLPQIGDDSQLTVFGYDDPENNHVGSVGIVDGSYYVSRVEAYLRAVKIPYTKAASNGGSENPRGKLPFANVKGQMVDDSARIIRLVNEVYQVDLDKGLSETQKVTAHLVREMLHGSLYWVMVYLWFQTEAGRKEFRADLASIFPPVISDLVVATVSRRMFNNLFGHGMGRMPEAEVIAKGKGDLHILSTLLGTQTYMLGTEEPTSVDTDCYALLVYFFDDPVLFAKLSWTHDVKKECPNLVTFVERMKATLFPELTTKES